MKLVIDYINVKIPIVRFIRKHNDIYKKFPIANHVKDGSIVITERALDIGIVGGTKNGKPLKIYGRPCYGLIEYGGIDTITWYDTGIRVCMEDWLQIANDTKDAEGFHRYWLNRIGIEGWHTD